jgi:NADH dehydrogenase
MLLDFRKGGLMTENHRPVVAVIGSGFGGMQVVKNLRHAPVQVVLIDKRNFHLFQPLLYQVATAGLAPEEIIYPVRSVFRGHENFTFLLTEVQDIDLNTKVIHTSTVDVKYDYLVLAVGSETNFFGLESVEKNGIPLKELDDAMGIRNHILKMFELSNQTEDRVLCQALRTFVITGGGPTGVECSGALSELIRLVLIKDLPGLDFDDIHVILLEATDHLLSGFPEDLAEAAVKKLREKHVEVHFGATVEDYDGKQVKLKNGDIIQAYTLIWAAGVKADSLLNKLGIQQSRQGRAVVEPTLQVPGYPEVFIIGDAAYMEDNQGRPLPMMAPVAIQQGKTAARNIASLAAGRPLSNFEYKDPGSLATIGRNAAVARIKNFKFSGFFAWIVWLAVHLFWLIGFRNRLIVMINWAWDYFFFDRVSRLIMPDGNPRTSDTPWPADSLVDLEFQRNEQVEYDRP